MFDENLILATDFYKPSMYLQYPPGTKNVHSYIEARGTTLEDGALKFFGAQYILKRHLMTPVTLADVREAKEIHEQAGVPFNEAGWNWIVSKHGGYLPLKIRAVPEGLVLPTSVPLLTVEVTDEQVPWLTTHVEGVLLRLWYPTTVATISHHIKKLIERNLRATADNLDGLPFKLHDFGFRGVSSGESAGIGGLAHLVNFVGTDTIPALTFARDFYNHKGAAGFSIPAAEHSTITAWGKDGEADAFANMLTQFGQPGKILAVVSDSYDIYNAVDNLWGQKLKDQVVASGATLVIRPDSGDPETVVAKCASLIEARFGTTTNSKGYKVFNNVRLIQGDGVEYASIKAILARLTAEGFSGDNIAFGMGGALLQHPNRDTMKFAMKASAIKIGDEWRGISKDPVTDPGKKSKMGRQDTTRWNLTGGYEAVSYDAKLTEEHTSIMRTVLRNGELLVDEDLETIRARG